MHLRALRSNSGSPLDRGSGYATLFNYENCLSLPFQTGKIPN